jgi:hypothetical protein
LRRLSAAPPSPDTLAITAAKRWSFAAVAASPVWKLLGAEGLATDHYPAAGERVLSTLGYYMHEGRHGILPGDWPVFVDFLRAKLGGFQRQQPSRE